MTTLRVVHYLNQFFAGIGAEDKADTPPGRREGALGPGRLLQQALGERARVVATVYCGDNHASENAQALGDIVDLIAELGRTSSSPVPPSRPGATGWRAARSRRACASGSASSP